MDLEFFSSLFFKRSSLVQKFANYRQKSFITFGPGCACCLDGRLVDLQQLLMNRCLFFNLNKIYFEIYFVKNWNWNIRNKLFFSAPPVFVHFLYFLLIYYYFIFLSLVVYSCSFFLLSHFMFLFLPLFLSLFLSHSFLINFHVSLSLSLSLSLSNYLIPSYSLFIFLWIFSVSFGCLPLSAFLYHRLLSVFINLCRWKRSWAKELIMYLDHRYWKSPK